MVSFAKVARRASSGRPQADRCHRCGGLMVPEQVHELGAFEARCVSCGERVDPVILAHRRQVFTRTDAEPARAGHGSRLG